MIFVGMFQFLVDFHFWGTFSTAAEGNGSNFQSTHGDFFFLAATHTVSGLETLVRTDCSRWRGKLQSLSPNHRGGYYRGHQSTW